MQPGNIFNSHRFFLLFKQNAIHHSKFFLQSLFAFSGGLFILLFVMQIFNSFRTPSPEFYFIVFLVLFSTTGILLTGTAFPALRSKEMSHNFFMIPASLFEKFVLELINRILLFVLIVPFLYWVVYNIEGYVANLFFPEFLFKGQAFFQIPDLHMPTDTATRRTYFLIPLGILLALVIWFTGSTMFRKSPVLKTLLAVAIIFFFNLFLIYFFVEILDFSRYRPITPILFLRHLEDALMTLIFAFVIFITGFILAAYFKLKEKEV